ncbi:MAG TPA: thiamine phosphate synthase [Longimicrobiaceae bacterium]|nr:thiamine phosphate synthase [Longimicrobiaceae bacterium]
MNAPSLAERLALTVITDPSCGDGRSLVEVVRAALQGGAPAIQMRVKNGSGREMMELGALLLAETTRAGALLFVNDRVDVALALGADGAHIGADDLPLPAARKISPPGFLLGRSVDSAAEARQAELDGADYVGLGPVLATPSKGDAGKPIGLAGVREGTRGLGIPTVVIGGIDARNTAAVVEAGADGVAVIRAVLQAVDPAAAARELIREVVAGREARPQGTSI